LDVRVLLWTSSILWPLSSPFLTTPDETPHADSGSINGHSHPSLGNLSPLVRISAYTYVVLLNIHIKK
jgi:hypothetical protein